MRREGDSHRKYNWTLSILKAKDNSLEYAKVSKPVLDRHFLLRVRGMNSAFDGVCCAFELRWDGRGGEGTFTATSACPSCVSTACVHILTSSLHLFLSPQITVFSIQDHGGSSGKLCTELGNLLAGFKVIYSLQRVFEHL